MKFSYLLLVSLISRLEFDKLVYSHADGLPVRVRRFIFNY
jgi:hypothetical protein